MCVMQEFELTNCKNKMMNEKDISKDIYVLECLFL